MNNGFEQYSADEEEVGGERDDSDEEEDVQPEPVKRTSTRGGRRSMSKASNASNSSKINEMRKRMNAGESVGRGNQWGCYTCQVLHL